MEHQTRIIVKNNPIGTRLDVFLRDYFPNYSRTFLARNIRLGNITVSKKKVKPLYILKKGDRIEVILPEKTSDTLQPNSKLSFPVLFENSSFLAINKPAGIQIHPSRVETQSTVANWILAEYPEIASVGEDSLRPGIVHRLDKDTSGVLLIAKNQKSFLALKQLFASRKIQKTYLAIVFGVPKQLSGIINAPVARSQSFRKQVVVKNQTRYKGIKREAITHYRTIRNFQKNGQIYSLLEISPKTGRMHQIRAHLSSIGNPIVGDTLYKRKECVSPEKIHRHLLHAERIAFFLGKEKYSIKSPIPSDMRIFLKQRSEK